MEQQQSSAGDSKQRFSARVADYVRARPGYPAQLLPLLRERIGLHPDWTIADIGSGTGISARPFLANGNTVIGIEPNAPMRDGAGEFLRTFPKFSQHDGSAEATGLDDASVDLVIAGQAFHWFDPPRARAEFVRILKPGGFVLLMWNNRRKSGDAFHEAYEQLLRTYGTDYLKIRHENIDDPRLAAFFAPQPFEKATLPNQQVFDFEGLKSRLLSSSYVPLVGQPSHEAMLDDLGKIFDLHQRDGTLLMAYDTELFFGRIG
jgi:SAM-dependent methyltransferase